MTFRSGEILEDRYKINDLLGQGGFGAVYKAIDLRLNILCAIKESFDVSETATRQFRREASMLAELRHPNLPRVTDYFDLRAKGLYLVMDFIEGEDLGTKLIKNGGGFTQEQVTPWLRQICDALDYLHSHNPPIIHRDIKLQNIIVTKDNIATLVDFGLAKFYDPSRPTTMGAQGGTPGFSPIEQYGQGKTDQRSDIYSLGATIYTLLTGQVPPESIQRVSNKIPIIPIHDFNPSVSSQLEKAVRKSLWINPAKRIQTVRELIEVLASDKVLEVINDNSSVKGIAASIQYDAFYRSSEKASLPSQASEWNLKGEHFFNQKRYKEALHCYDKALEIDPQNGKAWNRKGWTLRSLDRHEEALRCLDKALEIDPQNGKAWNNKGRSLGSLDRYEEALRCFDKALKLDPQDSWAWNNKGWSLGSLDRHEEAIRCLDKALEIDPQDRWAWGKKGWSLGQLGRHEEAIRCLDKALEIDPQRYKAWNNKGWILGQLGRHKEAILC